MGALDPMRQASAEALGDLAIGIDAGEIDGPVWSVSDRGTAGAFRSSRADVPLDRVAQMADRKYCRPHARPFRLGFPRKVPMFPICPPAAL
jgi:hypothetical protein